MPVDMSSFTPVDSMSNFTPVIGAGTRAGWLDGSSMMGSSTRIICRLFFN